MIKFLSRKSDPTEVQMGQYLYFYDQFMDECDAISVSANPSGFTPLSTISSVLGWDWDMVNKFAAEVNERNEVGVSRCLSHKLLLVPHVLNNLPQYRLAEDLFKACNAIKANTLRFTHYGLILGAFPREQIKSIMEYIIDNEDSLSIEKIYWDIDERFEQEVATLWNELRNLVAPTE